MTETSPQTQWYLAREGKQIGPITDEEMRILVQGGHVLPTDLVWRPGFDDWLPAQNVFPRPAPQPSPDPTPPARVEPEPVAPVQPVTQTRPVAPQSAPGGERPTARPAAEQGNARTAGEAPADHLASVAGPVLQKPVQATRPASRPHNEVAPILDDPEPELAPRAGVRRMALVAVLMAVVGVAGLLAYQNRDTLMAAVGGSADAQGTAPPVVKASGATKTAALDEVRAPAPAPVEARAEPVSPTPPAEPLVGTPGIITTLPPAIAPPVASNTAAANTPAVAPEVIDADFQKSALWALMKREFPEWYAERITEVAQMSGGQQNTDVSKHLVKQLVLLRRRNAEHALAASNERLRGIATAFLANLKTLSGHSTQACYTFISHGEASKEVIGLFNQQGYSEGIEAHIAAVFEAVADGRTSPVKRERAAKAEYDVLAAQLQKMGWSRTDLKLFASPDELAKAPHEQVCKMVQDWFAAHIAIPDAGVQERLLYETLRPVVAG
ncbi:MAG: GYF domain-containing protein [Hyphomicrobiaceae bacterium]|nr:GYF domain-containing protein [Hyphomicrobiaceae bacterium]